MTEHGKSIYKACREQAGLTQEDAAERLSCSVRSLARYEAGEAQVPDDIAYRMVVLYDSQYLAVEHLRQASQVAARILPPLSVMALPVAVIRIINRVRAFAARHRDTALLQIAEDGVISDEERPLFDAIMEDLDEIIQSCMELKLSEKGAHPCSVPCPRVCAESDCKTVATKENPRRAANTTGTEPQPLRKGSLVISYSIRERNARGQATTS